MGFKFRYRAKVFPGVHLNFSSKGLSSVSIGGRGATLNVGRGGRQRLTVGIPGSGMSYVSTLYDPKSDSRSSGGASYVPAKTDSWVDQPDHYVQPQLLDATGGQEEDAPSAVVIPPAAVWSDESLSDIKSMIESVNEQRKAMGIEVDGLAQQLHDAEDELARISVWYLRWFNKKNIASSQVKINSLQSDLADAQRQLDESHIPIDWTMEEDLQARWNWFVEEMRVLARSNAAILHRGESTKIDRVVTRSAANEVVDLKATKVVFKRPAYLPAHADSTVKDVPCFTSEKGFAAYFFPSFVLVERDGRFGLVRPEQLKMDGIHLYRLISEEAIPGGEIIDQTWKYVNKDGNPDRRFSNNYQIPVFGLHRVSIFAPEIFSEHFYFASNANALMRWEEVAFWHRASQRMDATKNVVSVKYPGDRWRYIILDSDGEEVPTILSRGDEPEGPPFSFQVKDELGLVCAISRAACKGVNLKAPVEFDIFVDDVLVPVDKQLGGNFNAEANLFIFPLRQLNDHLPLSKMLSGAHQLMFRAYQNGRAVNAGLITLPQDFWSAINMQLPQAKLTQAKAGSISLDGWAEGSDSTSTSAQA